MVELTAPQHGDQPDAAIFASMTGVPPTSQIISGLGLSADFSAGTATVAAGKAIVDRGDMTSAHPDISPQEVYRDAAAVVQLDSQVVSLSSNTTNHVFVDANVNNDDSPTAVVNTTNSLPTAASFKIGEVDTSADTVRERWRLVVDSGALSFPDEAAIRSEDSQGRLREGSVAYSRVDQEHFKVI